MKFPMQLKPTGSAGSIIDHQPLATDHCRPNSPWSSFLLVLLAGLAVCPPISRGADSDLYQLNVNPYHPITDQLSMFGNFGCAENSDSMKYRFGWPGLIYRVEPWLQLWGGLDSYYTANDNSADTLELRPFAGMKFFYHNQAKILLYNFTRYEYRAVENVDTHDWSNYSRIRSRFGLEAPLTSRARAWEAKTFYLLTDVEPFYRFDTDEWDPVRLRGGLGYILNDRVRIEFIYTAEFTRSSPGSSLAYADNAFELNFKIALSKGVLGQLFNPGD